MNRKEYNEKSEELKAIMLNQVLALQKEFLDSNIDVKIGSIITAHDWYNNNILIEVKHIEYGMTLGEPTLIAAGPELLSDSPTYFKTYLTVPRNID